MEDALFGSGEAEFFNQFLDQILIDEGGVADDILLMSHTEGAAPADFLISCNTQPKSTVVPILAPRKKRRQATESKLSVEERKANHIASEQKRRQNIRMGLEALAELVPALKEMMAPEAPKRRGTICDYALPTKSVILHKAADFIESLNEQHEALAERLNALQGIHHSSSN